MPRHLTLTCTSVLTWLLIAGGATAQVDPKPLAIEFDHTVLRPMQLESGDALAAFKRLVEQGFACRLTAPGTAYKNFPVPPAPAGLACERKLGPEFNGYPRLMVSVSTPGQMGDAATRLAQLNEAQVQRPHAWPWVPYRAVTEDGVAAQAARDLQAWAAQQTPLAGTAAAVTRKLLLSGLACGVRVGEQMGVPLQLACVLPWPTPTCRTAELQVAMKPGPDAQLARPADLLWSEAHEATTTQWQCLDPTTPNRKGDDARSALLGWRH